MKAWLAELWLLLKRRSRTAWGLVVSFAALVVPTLLDNLGALHELLAAIGAPPWARPVLTIIGAIGAAYALNARVNDAQTGRNPQ